MAIARAIVTDPVLLLADEPTCVLDSRSTADVLALFDGFNADGRTVVVITHEPDVAAHAKRVLCMRDGTIVSDERVRGRPTRRRVGQGRGRWQAYRPADGGLSPLGRWAARAQAGSTAADDGHRRS